MTTQNILKQLISIRNTLPRKQKKVCDYIIKNYEELSVLSISELAKRTGVGQTTVLRFITNIGFDNYNDFKKQLHYYTIKSTQPTWWHLEKSLTTPSDSDSTINETWTEIMDLLNKSLHPQLIDNFNHAIQLITTSSTVNIIGLRTSKAPAYYFKLMLSEFYPNVRQLSFDIDFIYDRLLYFNKDDVLIIISLAPYSTKTIEIAKYCYEEGIPILLITDQLSSPISSFANIILTVKASRVQYSITPVIALIEALVIEIGRKTSDHSVKHLKKLNKLLTDKNITTQ